MFKIVLSLVSKSNKMETNNDFTQLCVWTGCIVGSEQVNEFTEFMKKEVGVRVVYCEELKTLPSEGEEGGRNDLLFYVHSDDIPKFSIQRFGLDGVSWWEDALRNWGDIYPYEIKNKYPKTW